MSWVDSQRDGSQAGLKCCVSPNWVS
ncbi:hypothetical protein LINPERPRIM_LOCUS152 [Linum perenne]